MVTILDRLIARHVLYSMLLVLGIFLALTAFFVMVEGLSDYGKAGFGLFELVKYVVLKQPRQIYELFPIVALIGTIMGLSTLALNSELIAMRAAGVSVARIVMATMKIGLVFTLVAALAGEFVVPTSENLAQLGRAKALAKGLQKQSSGIWLRSGTSFVSIGEVLPDLSLLRVNIYDFSGYSHLRAQTFASRAFFSGDRWHLEDVQQSLIVGQEAVQSRHALTDDWQSQLSPDVVSVFMVQPEGLSIQQLRYYIQHLQQNNQDTRNYRLVFWQKLFLPLATLTMMLLATPFVFRPNRAGGVSQRVFTGVMLGLAFVVANQSFGYFGLLYGIPPVVGALAPTLSFFILALYLLRRASRGL